MKYAAVILVLALIVAVQCKPQAEKWTNEQISEHLNNVVVGATCINYNCRTSCVAEGYKTGFCSLGACTCKGLISTS